MGNILGKQQLAYMPQLDGLRAIAVLAVLFHHFLPSTFILNTFQVGALGVRFFFVLSGFLITGILLRYKQKASSKRQINEIIKSFYMRRFIRTFPAYYIYLFVALTAAYQLVSPSFFWHFFYLSNIYFGTIQYWEGFDLLPHLWSLAVEEQFYLVWPFVVLYLPQKHLLKVLIATILGGALFRSVLLGLSIGNPSTAHILPISCLDSLCLGALLAYTTSREYTFFKFRKPFLQVCLWFGVPCFVLLNFFVQSFYNWGGPLFAIAFKHFSYGFFTQLSASLAFVLIIEQASQGFKGPLGYFLSSKPMLYLGKISYGIYLYHLLAAFLLNQALVQLGVSFTGTNLDQLLLFLGNAGVTVLLAALSWKWLEEPINQLKHRFPYLRQEQTRHRQQPQI